MVVWSSAASGPARAPAIARTARTRRGRRLIRTGALLMMVGALRFARGVGARWQPLLPGISLTVAGIIMDGSSWAVLALPGLMFLAYAPVMPVGIDPDRERLEHELSAYSTHAQRCDLEATLARYPDTVTGELRDILSGQASCWK
jgi:hypothetical protein